MCSHTPEPKEKYFRLFRCSWLLVVKIRLHNFIVTPLFSYCSVKIVKQWPTCHRTNVCFSSFRILRSVLCRQLTWIHPLLPQPQLEYRSELAALHSEEVFGCFQKLMQLILSLTVHLMYIWNNVFEHYCGVICKINKQWQKRLYHAVTIVIVLRKL